MVDALWRWGEQGVTLIELLVVIIVMTVAVGIVAPAFLPPKASEEPVLAEALRTARRLALTRGETVYLDVSPTGDWTAHGASSPGEGSLATGRAERWGGLKATVVASPLGTCAYDVHSTAANRAAPIEPLTCTPVEP
jgi:prepilin-type N-terminal cleavage/methylation domain-containing protein